MIEFCVFGDPRGKGRPRFRGHAYTDSKTRAYERMIQGAFLQSGESMFPEKVPVGVEVECYFRIPTSYSKRRKGLCRENLELPLKKPDGDNVLKIVCDALNGLAYKDDTQVSDMIIRTRYGRNEGYIRVRIWEVKP